MINMLLPGDDGIYALHMVVTHGFWFIHTLSGWRDCWAQSSAPWSDTHLGIPTWQQNWAQSVDMVGQDSQHRTPHCPVVYLPIVFAMVPVLSKKKGYHVSRSSLTITHHCNFSYKAIFSFACHAGNLMRIVL
jgi:hypothetical protein